MSQQYVYLTSENFIKSHSNISDNASTKFVVPVMREVQDTAVQQTIGTPLYRKLQSLISTNTIDADGNEHYKELLNVLQYMILYYVAAELCMIFNFKLDNIGTYRTNDENAYSLEVSDVVTIKDYYTNKADFYKDEVQRYLCANRKYFPELTVNKYYQIAANLFSAASSGMWLGGARGKRGRRYPYPTYGYDYEQYYFNI